MKICVQFQVFKNLYSPRKQKYMKNFEKFWKKKKVSVSVKKNFGSDTDTDTFGRYCIPIPKFGRTLQMSVKKAMSLWSSMSDRAAGFLIICRFRIHFWHLMKLLFGGKEASNPKSVLHFITKPVASSALLDHSDMAIFLHSYD